MSYWFATLVLPPVLSVVPVPAATMTRAVALAGEEQEGAVERARQGGGRDGERDRARGGDRGVDVLAEVGAGEVVSAVIWRWPVSVPAARSKPPTIHTSAVLAPVRT